MKLADFDYELLIERVAQHPAKSLVWFAAALVPLSVQMLSCIALWTDLHQRNPTAEGKQMHRLFSRLLITFLLAGGSATAAAQEYPSRQIAIVIPYAAGGATDITARIVGKKLSEMLGKPVIMDNKPGAGGAIGTAAVAKAAPDGYTLLLGNTGPNAISPNVMTTPLGYDAAKDFAPITMVSRVPLVFCVSSTAAPKTMQELIALGKGGSRLNFGSSGNGSMSHLGTEWLNSLAGTKFVHIPYKGAAPLTLALISGEIQLGLVNGVDATAHVKSGKLRPLAVTAAQRSTLFPSVPTMGEAGLPALELDHWYGLLAPANTPGAIISRLNMEMKKILSDDAVKAQLTDLSSVAVYTTPEEFGALLKSDLEKYARIAKASGAKAD